MARARWAAIRPSARQMEAEQQAALGGGRARNAGSYGKVTAGTVANCTQAEALIERIEVEYLLADRGYDTNRALAAAREREVAPVITPKRSRKSPQEYDAVLYKARHLVDNVL